MQGIYCIENLKSGRKYYGSSQNVQKRLLQHQRDLDKNIHHNIQLQRCYNKHGNIFKYYLVEETSFNTPSELLEYEQTFIDNNVNGYNMAPANGGNTLGTHPDKDAIRRRITESHRRTLDSMTPEMRKEKYGRSGDLNPNWRNGGVSKKLCPECNTNKIRVKSKVCSTCRDRTKDKNPFYGRHHSDETKQKLREKLSGENSWIAGINPEQLPYTKYYEITYPNGTKKVVAGLKEIAKEFAVSIPNVHGVIKRCKHGKTPKRGKFAGTIITEVPMAE